MRHFTYPPKGMFTYDLHVLSMPPAFVLSQDQTLQLLTVKVDSVFGLTCYPQTISSVCYLVFKDPVSRLPSQKRGRSMLVKPNWAVNHFFAAQPDFTDPFLALTGTGERRL